MALSQLQGQIERITFSNEENNYTVAKLIVRGKRDLVTVIGNFPSLYAGEEVKLLGEWHNHPKFGSQFKVVKYESITPATAKGIQKYLGSGLIKGIGPVMAKRIVEAFGVETLEIIEHHPDRLTEVSGIGPQRITMISRAWADQKEIRGIMIFLQDHGVSTTYATKIYKYYGQNALKVVKENPYQLASDIYGIGFLTADKIAQKIGFAPDSSFRAEAGILYVLQKLSEDGHVFYPEGLLIEKTQEILSLPQELIIQALQSLAGQRKIVLENLSSQAANQAANQSINQAANQAASQSANQAASQAAVNQSANQSVNKAASQAASRAVYLAKFYTCETNVAARLLRIKRKPKFLRPIDMSRAIQWVQTQLNITLAEKQIEAIKAAIQDKVIIITGGPGTGKTTIVNSIIRIYEKIPQKVLLAAPTGRAAKRLAETTGHEAKTIHRLLEFQAHDGSFKKNEQEPLKAEVLIVDEASMIDLVLMHHLIKAVPPGATLILVGDIHQLPSVGAGNVLKDLIDSHLFSVVELNEIFRQAKESMIIVNAHRINQGLMPQLPEKGAPHPADFYFFYEEDPQKALEKILDLLIKRIPSHFHIQPLSEVQVITPMYKGIIGAMNLNNEIQKSFHADQMEVQRAGRTFKLHDKVMQIRNDYEKEVYNGDIGTISFLNLEDQELAVTFDGREVNYDFSDLDDLVLAYAISVHKAQGSEYPVIIIPVMTQHYLMLQRNLLYTAVTRAKKLVILIGTKKALAIAIKNNKVQQRYSHLADRLKINNSANH